ncbi:two-component sensor histidine kinase [Sphingomonas paucimobilis]|uniref:histidine kinase n=2 Tax=Sphingomonas paucimobilis TaxID=13689 RepID=A0A411LFR1_SPHPI|nr:MULTISPECIES: ATP-binding protein [Sphingomonas]MBQ1480002.1 HAMP domain-containing protein [Sphingomonas sp.]MCM3679095.1 ATP-binding protein [Sphingomonas paucimobilis]MDG5971849.1 HAMP domain-containing protein [Sphingomonas paucimobilis]NNG58141.1 HAMP domain-containing protein [Sphingomonas paucimobilis]QBE91186.1 HAMP domain-containing protein [Sphingomonas paucimobilis]
MLAFLKPADPTDTPRNRFAVTPAIEIVVIVGAVAIAIGTYWFIAHRTDAQGLIAPPVIAGLLALNLVPGILLLMLLGRRVAMRRAAASAVGGGGRLHVRLVAIFSLTASVPILLTVVTASMMFQSSAEFWISDRARKAFGDAMNIARQSQQQIINRWVFAGRAMSQDLGRNLPVLRENRRDFHDYLVQQTIVRDMEEAVLFSYDAKQKFKFYDFFNQPSDATFRELVTPEMIDQASRSNRPEVGINERRVWVVTPLPDSSGIMLYVGTSVNAEFLSKQHFAAEDVVDGYRALQGRARSLQLKFNLALFAVALLIVGIAVWIALAVADRLVRPVGELVEAARRIAGGDLTARVPDPRTRDEVGTLANAFNQMTGQLEQQNTELVTANAQLDNRRALIEAVMAGVSAGVMAVGRDRQVRIANNSADLLLGADEGGLVGRKLGEVAPELDELLDQGRREATVQIALHGDMRTLAVRIAQTGDGPILTFDDITQQLLDQRRAAWSDVARRIAHEIKNPLTPIQLAAERLQRRYGKVIDPQDETFGRLTETIVRQVGDLRRMVDEFSSFARMPKPVFREEAIADICAQAMFLHEVAHPEIRFELVQDDPVPSLVCDRRQMSQALTNIVKNAVEAIEARPEGAKDGKVLMIVGQQASMVTITVADNGVGLPPERDRIIEPYMTTRARGTGLGLAIVNKIIEEHAGTIGFSDNPTGGTIVSMMFDAGALAALDQGGAEPELAGEGQLTALTRTRT